MEYASKVMQQAKVQSPAVESPEDSFRRSLEDVLVIVNKLGPLCDNVSHLVDLVSASLENEATFQFLINLVKQPIQVKR